jgi:hypothetical protein
LDGAHGILNPGPRETFLFEDLLDKGPSNFVISFLEVDLEYHPLAARFLELMDKLG